MTNLTTAISMVLILISASPHASEVKPSSNAKTGLGLGLGLGLGIGTGTLLGALIGGPPGAIIGAAGGAWFGERNTRKTEHIATLKSTLANRTEALADLQYEFDQTQLSATEAMRQVRVNYVKTTAELLPTGLSFNLYFRTGSAQVNPDLQTHVKQLAALLTAAPGLKVHLSGHADERGSEPYNLILSEQRIEAVQQLLLDSGLPVEQIREHAYGETQTPYRNGDLDGYAFDRKVSIVVSINDEA